MNTKAVKTNAPAAVSAAASAPAAKPEAKPATKAAATGSATVHGHHFYDSVDFTCAGIPKALLLAGIEHVHSHTLNSKEGIWLGRLDGGKEMRVSAESVVRAISEELVTNPKIRALLFTEKKGTRAIKIEYSHGIGSKFHCDLAARIGYDASDHLPVFFFAVVKTEEYAARKNNPELMGLYRSLNDPKGGSTTAAVEASLGNGLIHICIPKDVLVPRIIAIERHTQGKAQTANEKKPS